MYAEDVSEGRGKPTATDLAYDVLKRRVLTCDLAPGQALRENDLANDIALSRTPVREALNRLVHDGFIEVRPRKGYRVTEVTLAGVTEAFELRALLEPPIAAAAAGVGRTDPARLTRLTALALDDPPTDLAGAILRDHDVHERLAGLAGNRYLTRSMRQLLAELQRIMFLALSGSATRVDLTSHHRALSDAVTAGDADGAVQVVLQENEHNRRLVLDNLLTRLPDVVLSPAGPTRPPRPGQPGQPSQPGPTRPPQPSQPSQPSQPGQPATARPH